MSYHCCFVCQAKSFKQQIFKKKAMSLAILSASGAIVVSAQAAQTAFAPVQSVQSDSAQSLTPPQSHLPSDTQSNATPNNPAQSNPVVLQSLQVTVSDKIGRTSTEVTGLGKIVKSSDDLNKAQVLGIRDLARYDPGVAVVEQGRGASSGYSVRGVDRNRVAVQVDGLAQAQSYITEHSYLDDSNNANGGAINEIEYENIRSVELSKGASSSDFGSGALGGAVAFRTKEAKDILSDDKNWGVDAKTAYSSKNNQWLNSVGVAGRSGQFDGLIQLTHRKGQETKAHKAIDAFKQSITSVGAYASPYDLRPRSPFDKRVGTQQELLKNGWFVLRQECTDPVNLQGCTPKPKAETTKDTPDEPRLSPPFTAKEQAIYDSMQHKTEQVSAKDYTGAGRLLPNPMDYQSKSVLFKGGYYLTDKQYLGAVFEKTQQQYDIQDKTRASYITPSEAKRFDRIQNHHGIYTGNNVNEGILWETLPFARVPIYSTAVYYDEHHDKSRAGLYYQYNNADNAFFDNAKASFDRQTIDLSTKFHEHRCSDYPTFDKNCRASVDKPWSSYQSHRNTYQESHNLFKASLDKKFSLGDTSHQVDLLAGLDKFESNLYRGDFFAESAHAGKYPGRDNYQPIWQEVVKADGSTGGGSFDNPKIYEPAPIAIHRTNYCKDKGIGLTDCTTRTITGHNAFLGLKHQMRINRFNLGVGLRYDVHQFESKDKFTGTGKYNNLSWNAGAVFKATDNIALSYRYSNGFRVPAFYELFGRRAAFDPSNPVSVEQQYVSKLSPEKASNQEFGVRVSNDFANIELSYFDNRYKDLITTAEYRPDISEPAKDNGYYNLQDAHLTGFNILGKIDWHYLSDKFPDGLYSTIAHNKIQVKKTSVKPGFVYTNAPLLDSLQPARYVVGLGYDSPDDKWGGDLNLTYSEAKNTNEVIAQKTGSVKNNISATRLISKPWYIYDVSGYWHINDNVTVRGSVYNLLDYKYSTWEAIRQSSVNAVNPESAGSALRYAAPGRHFSLALEAKF